MSKYNELAKNTRKVRELGLKIKELKKDIVEEAGAGVFPLTKGAALKVTSAQVPNYSDPDLPERLKKAGKWNDVMSESVDPKKMKALMNEDESVRDLVEFSTIYRFQVQEPKKKEK